MVVTEKAKNPERRGESVPRFGDAAYWGTPCRVVSPNNPGQERRSRGVCGSRVFSVCYVVLTVRQSLCPIGDCRIGGPHPTGGIESWDKYKPVLVANKMGRKQQIEKKGGAGRCPRPSRKKRWVVGNLYLCSPKPESRFQHRLAFVRRAEQLPLYDMRSKKSSIFSEFFWNSVHFTAWTGHFCTRETKEVSWILGNFFPARIAPIISNLYPSDLCKSKIYSYLLLRAYPRIRC